ncbi:MAG: energy-coupling factor transporter transmembrane component T family protein [Bacillota bacterium]
MRHPSAKILLFFGLLMPAVVFQHPLHLAFLGALVALLALRLRFSRGGWRTTLLLGGLGGLFTTLTWLPFTADGRPLINLLLPLTGWQLQVTDTGLLFALAMGLRIFDITLISLLYVLTTSPRQMTMGLRGVGIPFPVAHLFSMIFRLTPMVQHDVAMIKEAQQVRCLDLESGSAFARLRRYSALLGPLMISSLRRVQLIANALDAKGFQLTGGRHRFFQAPRWAGPDLLVALAGLALAAAVIAARWMGFSTLIEGRL